MPGGVCPIAAGVLLAGLLAAGPAATRQSAMRNLLPNASFELGLGAEPFYPGCTASPGPRGYVWVQRPSIDRSQAHSGRCSLKLHGYGPTRARLDVAGRMLLPGQVHRVQLWARASRPGVRVSIRGSTEGFRTFLSLGVVEWQEPAVALTTEWQRLLVGGPPVAQAGFGYVTIEFADPESERADTPFQVWVDDVAWTVDETEAGAGSGEGALDAGPSAPIEVVLLPQRRDGIYQPGDQVRLRYSVMATEADASCRLSVQVRDVGRDREAARWEGALTLRSGQPVQETVRLGALPRGAYMAEIRAIDARTGEVVCRSRERFAVLSRPGRNGPRGVALGVEHSSFFIYGTSAFMGTWRGAFTLDELFDLFSRTGFRVQRVIVDWLQCEPSEGRYDWRVTDGLLEAARRHGCRIIACIGNPVVPEETLARALKEPSSVAGGWILSRAQRLQRWVQSPLTPPEARNAVLLPPPAEWARFVLAFTQRYRDVLDALEAVNEVDLSLQPEDYIWGWLAPIYQGVRAAAPHISVLANPICDMGQHPARDRYVGRFLSAGGLDWCDGISYHPYSAPLLEHGAAKAMDALARLLDELAPGRRPVLAMTEIHHPHQEAREGYYLLGYDVVQRALLDWLHGARWSAGVVFDYSLFREVGWQPMYWRQARVPGPGGAAANALADVLTGHRLAGEIRYHSDVLCGLWSRPRRGHRPVSNVAVLTAADQPGRRFWLEGDLRGVPVTCLDAFGEPVEPTSVGLPTELRFGRDPLYLRSESALLFTRLRAARLHSQAAAAWAKETDYSPQRLVDEGWPGREP